MPPSPDPALAAPPRLGRHTAFVVAILALGAALRIHAWLSRRSLWIDEARLALNIGSRSFAGLLAPLDYDQSAPPLFLWGEKLMTRLFGVNELALRLIPLLAGLLALGLIYPTARRILTPAGALFAATVFAISPTLIYYSNELKQYGPDLAVTMVLVWLALRLWESGASPRARLDLLLAAIVAPWLSAPALFVLCGITLAIVLDRGLFRTVGPGWSAGFAAAYGCSFLLVYWLVYHPAAANPYLSRYWATSSFAPWVPDWPYVASRQFRTTFWGVLLGHAGPIYPAMRELTASYYLAIPVSVAGLAGAVVLIRRAPRAVAALVLGPVLAVVGASTIQAYPIALRVLLFTAPLLILMVAAAVERGLALASPRLARLGWAGVGMILLAVPFRATVEDAAVPYRPEHTRPLIEEFLASKTSDPIYVFSATLPAWAFYTTDWSRPDTARLAFLARIGSSTGPAFENAPRRNRPVRNEGRGLVRSDEGRLEIFGVPTGMEWSAGAHGNTFLKPDLCWADNEVKRIRDLTHSDVWIIVSHVVGPDLRLLDRMEQLGAREIYRREAAGSGLIRYHLLPSGRSACWMLR